MMWTVERCVKTTSTKSMCRWRRETGNRTSRHQFSWRTQHGCVYEWLWWMTRVVGVMPPECSLIAERAVSINCGDNGIRRCGSYGGGKLVSICHHRYRTHIFAHGRVAIDKLPIHGRWVVRQLNLMRDARCEMLAFCFNQQYYWYRFRNWSIPAVAAVILGGIIDLLWWFRTIHCRTKHPIGQWSLDVGANSHRNGIFIYWDYDILSFRDERQLMHGVFTMTVLATNRRKRPDLKLVFA